MGKGWIQFIAGLAVLGVAAINVAIISNATSGDDGISSGTIIGLAIFDVVVVMILALIARLS